MGLPAVWHLFGEDHVPYRLLLFARMIDKETARRLQSQFGLSLAEWRLLAIASTIGPCTASEIGTAGEIDRAEISRALAKLENAKLLQRKPDPAHRKRQIISLTPQGCNLFARVREERRIFFRSIMTDLSAQERTQLDASLAKMAECLIADANQSDRY